MRSECCRWSVTLTQSAFGYWRYQVEPKGELASGRNSAGQYSPVGENLVTCPADQHQGIRPYKVEPKGEVVSGRNSADQTSPVGENLATGPTDPDKHSVSGDIGSTQVLPKGETVLWTQ